MVIKKNNSDFLHENWQPGSVYILDIVTVTGVLCCTFICVHARQTHVQQVRELGGGCLFPPSEFWALTCLLSRLSGPG